MNKTEQFILVIDGPMGGGKSTVAKILHSKMKEVLFTGFDKVKWQIAGYSRSS